MATVKKKQLNEFGCEDCAKHVIVLVAGTSDAVNAFINDTVFSTDKHRANSYDSNAAYWKGELKPGLELLKLTTEEFGSMALMDQHGWSGDNRIQNREIAGKYLVDRISGVVLGKDGEKYYGKTHVNRPIYFHLVGHSHGGNVINEMTKRIDSMGDLWPELWKVKSITYLSTPFFTELHQVKVTPKVFHKDAEILHLYNDYDLTQRMLADFSLEVLAESIHNIDTSVFKEHLEAFKGMEFAGFYFDWDTVELFKDMDDSCLGIDIQHVTTFEDGKRVYDNYLKVFKAVKGIINEASVIVNELSKPIKYTTSKADLKNIEMDFSTYSRAIIPLETAARITEVMDAIIRELEINISAFETRNRAHANGNTPYNVLNLPRDLTINDFAALIADFLNIDRKTLLSTSSTGLLNSFLEIALHNIEKFDNTDPDPSAQFKGTSLADKVQSLNVTDRDPYDKYKPYSDNYKKFITHINNVEVRYSAVAEAVPGSAAAAAAERNSALADLIFSIVQQSAKARYYITKAEGIGSTMRSVANQIRIQRNSIPFLPAGKTETNLLSLSTTINNFVGALQDRDFGQLEPEYIPPSDEETKRAEAERKKWELPPEVVNNPLLKLDKNLEVPAYSEISGEEYPPEPAKKNALGSLAYLFITSHSISRKVLYVEVKDFLRRLGPKKR